MLEVDMGTFFSQGRRFSTHTRTHKKEEEKLSKRHHIHRFQFSTQTSKTRPGNQGTILITQSTSTTVPSAE
uniref:Uncharacterized protein n=1 Tax=Arundo donax TaxID=35708 RepID=A0A0A9FBX6_ARUDO